MRPATETGHEAVKHGDPVHGEAPPGQVARHPERRRDWPLVIALALLVVASWPQWALTPQAGLDPGWITGLQLAQVDGLEWGRDILYTYGPLGFIDVPQVWNLTGLVGGVLYGACAVSAITVVPYLLLRKQVTRVAALVFAAALALAAPTVLFLPELFSLGAFLLAVGFFQGLVTARPTPLAAALGVITGLQALVKPPTAFVAALACLLVVVAPLPGLLRRAGAGVAGLALMVLLGWLVTGQSLTDLPHWVISVADLARHYSEATFATPIDKFFELIAALIITVGLIAYVFRYAARMTRRNASVLLVTCAVTVWLTSKEAFVRHDIHSTIFFFTIAALSIAIRTVRPVPLGQLGMLVASGLVLTTLAAGSTLDAAIDPTSSVRTFFTLATYIVSPGNRDASTGAARSGLEAAYALPVPLQQAVSRGTVHVDPLETTLVWVYGFRWKPVPVFQRYAAFTSRADSTNAEALAKRATAPDRILRQAIPGFDGRNDLWDSPRYMVNLVCFYRQTLVTPAWQLLARARDRCGAMRFTKTISFRAGETVDVPRGTKRELVVVWLNLHQSLWERLRTILFRPSTPILVDAGSSQFRIATTQVAGPLLLHVPKVVGWDSPFGGGVDYRSLRVNLDGTARFAIVPLS